MNAILNAPADGTVFGLVQGSEISLAPSLIKAVNYEFHRDVQPITLAAVLPMVFAVPAGSPYKSLTDVMEGDKIHPKGIEVADVGRGTVPHLAATLMGLRGGVDFLSVHFQGGTQARQATIGGQTEMMVGSYNVVAGNVHGGKLRVLATMADRTEPGLEQFPLAKDAAPGAIAAGWFAVVAKKDLNAAIAAKMNKDMGEALLLPEVVAGSRDLGNLQPPGHSRAAHSLHRQRSQDLAAGARHTEHET